MGRHSHITGAPARGRNFSPVRLVLVPLLLAALSWGSTPLLADARVESPGEASATPQDAETRRPDSEILAEVRRLALPLPESRVLPGLVDRPIVLDYGDHSFTLGLDFQDDQRLESTPVAGFPTLALDTHSTARTLYAEYRRGLGEDLEIALRVPYRGLKESRPTRIIPLAVAPLFATVSDVRSESGLGDMTLSVARGWNRPGLSRKLALDVKLSTARSSIPDAQSLPLGSGQTDFALSYGIKRTRGITALTGTTGFLRRGSGSRSLFNGAAVSFDAGDEIFVSLRVDRTLETWMTGSLELKARLSERDSIAGMEQPGSTREFIALTPILTFQASPVLEVIAEVTLPLHAEQVADTARYATAMRWRY